jgi:hypothetical protein
MTQATHISGRTTGYSAPLGLSDEEADRISLAMLDITFRLTVLEESIARTAPLYREEPILLQHEATRLRLMLGEAVREYARKYGHLDFPLTMLGDGFAEVTEYHRNSRWRILDD